MSATWGAGWERVLFPWGWASETRSHVRLFRRRFASVAASASAALEFTS